MLKFMKKCQYVILILLMFYFLLSKCSFKLAYTHDTQVFFKLDPEDKFYTQLCQVFQTNNHFLWIEDSIENLIDNIQISFEDNEFAEGYFQINYFHKSVTEQGDLIKVKTKIFPFQEKSGFVFKKIQEIGIPPMKKSAFSPMFLNTVMLTYGH